MSRRPPGRRRPGRGRSPSRAAFVGAAGKARVQGTADAPLFCLADVCRALEIGNPSDVAKRLDDDEKSLVNTLDQIEGIRGNPNLTFVTEPGTRRRRG